MISLIPMAGKGNRFFQELYKVPKPFVPVMGNPMFIAAFNSFPPANKCIFICLEEHFRKYKIKAAADKIIANNQIVLVDKITEGPACTCLLAEDLLDTEEGLFIASCDYQTIYNSKAYEELLADKNIDVIVWTFKIGTIKKANPNAFAYCRTEGNRVVEIVEKQTISDTPHLDPAVVGSFTYRKSKFFLNSAKQMIKKNIRINNEFYVATSINQLIEEGYNVVTFEVDKFISFGNHFELMFFQYWQEYFECIENPPYSINCALKRQRNIYG
jgi:dTDP-glucose pyrophosphorylase